MLARYNRILHEYPVRANALTGLVLGAVGDILAQRLERQTLADQPASSIDREQCLRAASFAAAVNAVVSVVFGGRQSSRSVLAVVL